MNGTTANQLLAEKCVSALIYVNHGYIVKPIDRLSDAEVKAFLGLGILGHFKEPFQSVKCQQYGPIDRKKYSSHQSICYLIYLLSKPFVAAPTLRYRPHAQTRQRHKNILNSLCLTALLRVNIRIRKDIIPTSLMPTSKNAR